MSKLSVPEHMVKRKPPPNTKLRISRATARFISLTFSKPKEAADASCFACSSWYQAAFRYAR